MTTFSVILVSAAALNAAADNVLLDFSATWCGPCQQMNPIVSRLKRQGYPIRKVDLDHEPALARKYGIGSIPTFVLVVQGKEVDRIEGMTSERRLRSLLAKIPRPSEPKTTAPAPNSRAATKSSQPNVVPTAPHTKQMSTEPKRSFPFSLLGNKRQDHERRAEQPPNPPREPVIRAKHDSREPAAAAASVVDPFAASVRIRVRDAGGANFGSGTVIDSRPGRTIVLTCGHIFRGLSQSARIEVDVFTDGRHETFVGKVVRYDTEADVGLCAIPTDTTLPVSQVAAATTRIADSDPVYSIGCGGGEPPTQQRLRVTALNRYLGPDNIECTGIPEEGRSGGGLFNRSGELIGVCIAADRQDRRGLYAGLKTIHKLLDQAKLSRLYQRPASLAKSLARSDEPKIELATSSPRPSSKFERTDAGDVKLTALTPASETSRLLKAQADRGSNAAEALSSAIGPAGEAEVVCIIRPLGNPQAASRVVIINRASPKFVSYLTREMESQPHPVMRSVRFSDLSRAGARHYVQKYRSRVRLVDDRSSTVQPVDQRRSQFPPAAKLPNLRRPQRYQRSAESR